jgi:hypothetical protein
MCSEVVSRFLAVGLVVIAGCGGGAKATRSTTVPVPTVRMGDCADPERDGVLGAAPRLEHADRDLDGDGAPEVVVADRGMCTGEGNCWWNLFVKARADEAGCARYAGTIAAARLEVTSEHGEDGLAGLRGWWNLTGPGRFLVSEYGFARGGYQVVDTLLCRQQSDDRLLCAEDREAESP